jgi:hypothetical protein
LAWLTFVVLIFVRHIRHSHFHAGAWQRLLLPLLIVTLMGQTNLIAAPLDPLFSLAGVGYLAVGLGWDLLTAGSWANESSPALPRLSRIFLYLGYIILTAMLVNWAADTHDSSLLAGFTGQAALMGLTLLGYPYLYAILYLLMEERATSAPPPAV